MATTDPGQWTFGLTQLLTVIGLLMAALGFRTVAKWHREQIDQRKIDLASEALSLAYESKAVFENIRSRVFYQGEGAETPLVPGQSDKDRNDPRRPYCAVLDRIQANHDYFARVWKLEPKFIAIFGEEASKSFEQFRRARRDIEVAASFMVTDWRFDDRADPKELKQQRDIIFGTGSDPVTEKLENFRRHIDELCRPVICKKPWFAFWR
jgi:hypothetical protein